MGKTFFFLVVVAAAEMIPVIIIKKVYASGVGCVSFRSLKEYVHFFVISVSFEFFK